MYPFNKSKTFCILPWIHMATLTDGRTPLCCIADQDTNNNLNFGSNSVERRKTGESFLRCNVADQLIYSLSDNGINFEGDVIRSINFAGNIRHYPLLLRKSMNIHKYKWLFFFGRWARTPKRQKKNPKNPPVQKTLNRLSPLRDSTKRIAAPAMCISLLLHQHLGCLLVLTLAKQVRNNW